MALPGRRRPHVDPSVPGRHPRSDNQKVYSGRLSWHGHSHQHYHRRLPLGDRRMAENRIGHNEYFSDQLHAQDLQRLGVRIGGCEGQQALEALAVVAALRLWKQVWAEKRCNITVKSDNVTALIMTATLKGKKGPVALLARELALDIADGVYTPNVVAHVPGVANDSADALSRKYQPSKHFVLPRLLANAKEVTAPRRDNHWWRCSAAQEQMAHTGR